MSDPRYRRHRTTRDRSGHDFLVERPEVLDRSPATPDNDDVNTRNAADRGERPGNVERGAVTLDARRPDDDVRIRISAPQHVDDVADGGAVERRHDADLARQCRQRALAVPVEKALGRQALLELVEGQLQRAESLRLEMLADDLILAFRVVHADPAARYHAQPVARRKPQGAQGRPEHPAPDLRAGVFQREVHVARIPDAAVRQLAFDPDLDESILDERPDLPCQLGNRQDAPRRGHLRRRRRRRFGFIEWEVKERGHTSEGECGFAPTILLWLGHCRS